LAGGPSLGLLMTLVGRFEEVSGLESTPATTCSGAQGAAPAGARRADAPGFGAKQGRRLAAGGPEECDRRTGRWWMGAAGLARRRRLWDTAAVLVARKKIGGGGPEQRGGELRAFWDDPRDEDEVVARLRPQLGGHRAAAACARSARRGRATARGQGGPRPVCSSPQDSTHGPTGLRRYQGRTRSTTEHPRSVSRRDRRATRGAPGHDVHGARARQTLGCLFFCFICAASNMHNSLKCQLTSKSPKRKVVEEL
jgi:hypothetical protein